MKTFSPLREANWSLDATTEADIEELMTWFTDAESVNLWGGPEFRFPFTRETFDEDCRLEKMDSYSLRDEGTLAAFGQSYERYGRGHLARLISNPARRRTGAGRQLIRMITRSLDERFGYDEYSLFVYRHNTPAYELYLSLGYTVVDYPDDAKMADKCYFLTKKRRE